MATETPSKNTDSNPLPVTPSTLTTSKLLPEVVKSFGFPLPKKYESLMHLFVSMEKVVSVSHGRDMRITFENVAKNVMKNTKMTFTEKHLSQIVGVFSKAYDLRWEKHRQPIGKPQMATKYDLVIQPNLKDDLDEFLTEEAKEKLRYKSPMKSIFTPIRHVSPERKVDAEPLLKSPTKLLKSPCKREAPVTFQLPREEQKYRIVTPTKLISPTKRVDRDFIRRSPIKAPNTPIRRLVLTDPAPRMEGWRLTARKMVFRHILVETVKGLHGEFLKGKKETPKADQLLHADFKLDEVADLVQGCLPQMPKVDTPLRTMRDYLETVETTPVKKEAVVLPQKSPTKTPKESLLERIRAKEAALKLKKEQDDPEATRLIPILHLLKKSMVEVICTHYALKKITGMNIKELQPLVVISCGQMTTDKFKEHIDAMCSVAPKICVTETFLGATCLKIKEARADKILKCVDKELKKLNEKLMIKAEV